MRSIPRSPPGRQISPARRIWARPAPRCGRWFLEAGRVHFLKRSRNRGATKIKLLRTPVARKKLKKEKRWPLQPASQTSPAPWEGSLRHKPWRSQSRAAASYPVLRASPGLQWSESFRLSKSSSKGRTIVFASPSPGSSSVKTGSDTTYFSVAQFPRSRSRQRSLQKGKSAWTAESVSALQIGHLCFIASASSLCSLCPLC